MADERATVAVDLQSNVRSVAESDAEALERLQAELTGNVEALRNMQKAMRNLQGGKTVDIATTRKLRDEMAATKARIASTQQAVIGLGGAFKRTVSPANEAKGGVQRLRDAALLTGGPLGQLTGRLGALARLVGSGVIVAGIAAIAAACVALTAASLAAAGSLATYAIKQADARRSELLRLEGLTKIRNFMFGFAGGFTRAADKASYLQSTLDAVTAQVAIGRSEVAGYETQLYKMGLRGRNLKDALLGAAMTASAQGDEAAQHFMGWAAGAAAVGQSVRRLTDDVKARLGGIVKAQLLSLDVQMLKLREDVNHLFDGLQITPLLESLHTVLHLFSQQQAVGRALRGVIERAFKAFGLGGFDAGLAMKRFVQGLVIGVLTIEGKLLDLALWFAKTFGIGKRKADDFSGAVDLGIATVYGLAAALTVVGVTAAIAATPFYLLGKGLMLLWKGIKLVGGAASDLYDAGKKLGGSLMGGIWQGIKDGVGNAVKAVDEAAGSILGAFKSAMMIHSPSVRMRVQAGRPVTQGVALGIRDEVPRVRAASRVVAGVALRGGVGVGVRARAAVGVGVRAQLAAGRAPLAPMRVPAPMVRGVPAPPPPARGRFTHTAPAAPAAAGPVFHFHFEGGAPKDEKGGLDEARFKKLAIEAFTEAMRAMAVQRGVAS